MAGNKFPHCYATQSEDFGTDSTSCISISFQYQQLFLPSNKNNNIKIYGNILELVI